jgi:hypothetical protein
MTSFTSFVNESNQFCPEDVRKQKVSADIIECNKDRDVPELPCPACIKVAKEKNRGLVPENALQSIIFINLRLI